MSSKKKQNKTQTRRTFLKNAVVGAGSAAAFLGGVKFDAKTGIKIGGINFGLGMSEARATCGFSSDCAGGGGECGFSSSCAGN